MAAPPRPTAAVDCFKSRCAMGLVGVASSEGTLYCDMKNNRTRFEAFGGWSVTRFDLGVAVSHYVKANPPEAKLHEDPAQEFLPPEGAVFGGEEAIEGKQCQKWTFQQRGKAMTTEVDLWVTVDGDNVATPVVYRMKTPTQTIEMKFLELEPSLELDDALFDVEHYVPTDKPQTVSVRGVMTNQQGERVHGVAIAASYPDQGPNNKPEWTTRTGSQSDDQGEFELLLIPGKVWRLTVQGAPKYGARIFEITPPADGIQPGGAADVTLEPATGGQPAYGNPNAGGAYTTTTPGAHGGAGSPAITTTSSVGGGAYGGAGAAMPPGQMGGMPAGYTTAPNMDQMMAAQAQQQAAMAQAHAAMGQATAQLNAAGGVMAGMGMGGAAAQFHQGAAQAQMGQHQVAHGAAVQAQHFHAAQPAMQFHAQQQQAAAQPQAPPASQPASANEKSASEPAPAAKQDFNNEKSAPEASTSNDNNSGYPGSGDNNGSSNAAAGNATKSTPATPVTAEAPPAESGGITEDEGAPPPAVVQSAIGEEDLGAKPAASSNEKAAEPAAEPEKKADPAPQEKAAPTPAAPAPAPAAAAPAAAVVASVTVSGVSKPGETLSPAQKVAIAQKMNAESLSGTADKFSVGRTGFFSNWKKRIFKQQGNLITYHEKDGSPALGSIPLTKESKVHTDVSTTLHKEAKEPERDLVLEFDEASKKGLKLLIRFPTADDKAKWAAQLVDIQNLMSQS